MGGWVASVICIAAVGIAQYEMMRALRQRGHQNVRWPVWVATIISIPIFLVWDSRLLLPIVAVTALITIAYVLFHGEPHLDDILVSLMPLFSVALPGMCLLAQVNAPYRWMQVMLMCTSFLVPNLGDAAAYFVGSRFGRRKLIPAVSPNKTVAGAVGGLIGSEVTALVIWIITYYAAGGTSVPQFPPYGRMALLAGSGRSVYGDWDIYRHILFAGKDDALRGRLV